MQADDDPPLSGSYFQEGATLLVDKPKEWTSFDVVNKIRNKLKHTYSLKKIKVGHSGTLDPMATGLLVICTGKSTKQLAQLQGLNKTYTGTITLGATTPSYDAETEVDERFPIEHITEEALENARLLFLGDIAQVPPMFSAIKVDGQPLYKKARKGEEITIEPRAVTIFDFQFTRVELPELDFEVRCSKGTYIRSLAYDLGKALGSGGYLSALRRTTVGPFVIQKAWELDDLLLAIDKAADAAQLSLER